jgi:hypothetical protein
MSIYLKRLCLTIPFILLVVGLVLGQKKVDRELAKLVGPVKTVSEQRARYSGARPEPGDTVTYDLQGNEIERVMISDFGELMGIQTRTFNADGSLRESTVIAKGSVQRVDKYVFQAGRLTQILVHDHEGILKQKISKTYDPAGDLIEETYYDPETARARTVFRYEENGNLIETAFFLSDGRKAVAPIGPCLGAHRITYKYDSQKRIISSSAFETDGNEKKTWTYVYDERGNYSLYTIKSGSSTTRITYAYEYDSNGNWTKRTSMSENDDSFLEQMLNATGKKPTPDESRAKKERLKITSVTTRKITYHSVGN